MAAMLADPFDILFNLQRRLDDYRSSDWLARGPSGGGAYPPLNVFRQGDDVVVITELPGISRDDVEVQIKDNHIRIAGQKVVDYGEGTSLHRRERVSGTFDRTIALPVQIDADRVQAQYRDGVLALLLPRAEQDKPKSITIN